MHNDGRKPFGRILRPYSLRPTKTNIVLDKIFNSTTNLDKLLFRFVVLENIPSNPRLVVCLDSLY